MSSFINGPVIQFSVDVSGVDAELKKIYASVTSQTKAMTQQIRTATAGPLEQQAAKLRALYSTGAIGIKDLQVEQKKFLGLLDNEISRLVQKNDLTKQELSTLKQVTLERERQANAIQRGIGVGVTSGTQSALGLVNGNITRNISQLGARLIGVSGGSGAGEFAAAAQGIASVSAAAGPAVGVIGALVTTMIAAAIAAGNLAVSGGNLAERLSNISQSTGVGIQDLQVLESIAKTTNLDLDDLVTGFRKFSQAITGGAGGEAGGFEGAGKKASDILKILGVTSKDSFGALEQLADAFQKLPDGPVKSAAAIELLGRSGLKLIPILNQGRDGVEKYRAIVNQFAPEINDGVLKSQNDWNDANVKLSLSLDKLKVSLTPLLDTFAKFSTGIAELVNADSGDTKGLSGLQKFFLFAADPAAFGRNLANTSGLVKQSGDTAKTSAQQWADLGLGFDKAISAARAATPQFKALEDQLNGVTEAQRKAAEEAKKEAEALLNERFKAASESLNSISQGAQVGGLSAADKALEEERLKLEKIAQIILDFPNLAGQAATAAQQVVAATRGELEKLADESLKKLNDEQDRAFSEEVKRQQDLAKVIKEIDDKLAIDRAASTLNGVAKIIAENKKLLDDTLAKAKEQGASEQQLGDLRVKIAQDTQVQISKLRAEDVKKTQDEIKNTAGRLFDALISGTKNFTQALKQTLLAVVLTPVKLVFEAVVAAIFAPLVQRTKDALVALGKSLQGKGGILGKIGDILVPKDSETKLNTQVTGDNTTATSANTDALSALTSSLQSGGSGGSVSGAGLQLFSGGLSNGVDLLGSNSALDSNSENANGAFGIGDIAKAALGLGIGLGNAVGGKNLGAKIGGGITVAGGALSSIGKGLNNAGLEKFGAIGQGVGLVVSGVSDGGVKGVGESTLGGAEVGTAIAPGIGTAIGAAVGFVIGVVGAIFGHHGPSQKDIANAVKRQTIANPDQFLGVGFERSAQDRFADTLNSGFLESPGGTFSSFALGGSSRRPIIVNYSPTVHAIDAKGVSEFLDQHAPVIAQRVAAQVGSVRSGLGSAVRQAVHPA